MSDEISFPQMEELRILSRQSLVSYAVRCALRVQPLLATWKEATREYKTAVLHLDSDINQLIDRTNTNFPLSMRAVVAIFETKKALESSKGKTKASDAFAAVKTISNAAHLFDLAMNSDTDEFQIIDAAFNVASDSYFASTITAEYAAATVEAARADYNILISFNTDITDASETGLLGDLWHGSPPEWYVETKIRYENAIAEWKRELSEDESTYDEKRLLSVYIDPGTSSPELITELYVALDALYRANGGSGLEIVKEERRSLAGETV